MENYPYIPFVPDIKTVLKRMGSHKADFSAGLESEINSYYKMAGSAFSVAGRADIYGIQHISEDAFLLNGQTVESALLSRLLGASDRIYLMCAAIPQRDVDKISGAMESGRGLLALVLDAYASEYVDGALDVIMGRKNAMLKRTGEKLTKRRFSAGYGDLDLNYQKVFYDLLDMQSLGVKINDKFLMAPEKSVIAIAGVVEYEEG
ncbi:MAG: hypothetical protein PHO15_10205 [Eubacteriales bacterium]|nr:hypothetical protein [Eubacteriales bacterium]